MGGTAGRLTVIWQWSLIGLRCLIQKNDPNTASCGQKTPEAMESLTIESVVAAARQSNEMVLGQILDRMAEVNSADGVDQVLELFLNDMIKSTIVPDPIKAADGLYQPLIDILA